MIEAAADGRPWTWRSFAALVSRFGLAGVANTTIGFGLIAALDVGLHLPPALANAAGYLVGVGVSFVLNRRFVFRSDRAWRATAPRYATVVAVAFVLNQLVLEFAHRALGPGAPQHLAAQLAGMATYTATVFAACRWWVFRPETSS